MAHTHFFFRCFRDTKVQSCDVIVWSPLFRSDRRIYAFTLQITPTHPCSRPKELSLDISLDGSQTREIHLLSVIAMSFLPQLA